MSIPLTPFRPGARADRRLRAGYRWYARIEVDLDHVAGKAHVRRRQTSDDAGATGHFQHPLATSQSGAGNEVVRPRRQPRGHQRVLVGFSRIPTELLPLW
jgi:hypothetical protein